VFWSVLAAVLLVAAGYTGNAQAQDVVSAGFNLPVNVGANLKLRLLEFAGTSD